MAYDPVRHHRRSIRLRTYDYAWPGAYFVTICTYDRACLFGEVVDGVMRLNAFGRIARAEWIRTASIRPDVRLDAFVIMPDHMHGIIHLLDDGVDVDANHVHDAHGGADHHGGADGRGGADHHGGADPHRRGADGRGGADGHGGADPHRRGDDGRGGADPHHGGAEPHRRRDMMHHVPTTAGPGAAYRPGAASDAGVPSGPGAAYRPGAASDGGVPSGPGAASDGGVASIRAFAKPVADSLSSIVGTYKAAVTRRINGASSLGVRVWQSGFYEHVIRNRRALEYIRRYIERNPSRWR